MKKNKFLSWLKKLNEQELIDFHNYLKRYHRRDKIALNVFEYLAEFHPKFEQKDMLHITTACRNVFKKDLPKSQDAEKKMRNSASELTGWLKEFLIDSKIRQNQTLQESIWLGILHERNMKEEFSKKAQAFYMKMQAMPFRSTANAISNWVASYYYRTHLAETKPRTSFQIEGIHLCTQMMVNCMEVVRLKMACETSVLKTAPAKKSKRRSKSGINNRQAGIEGLLEMFETLWHLIGLGEESYFEKLEILIHQYAEQIDLEELFGVINYAYNFISEQSRQTPNPLHYERMHRLDKIALLYGVYSEHRRLGSYAFGNIVTVACHTKNFDWALEFIQNYNNILFDEEHEDAILLAQAILAFETGKHQDTIHLLKDIPFDAPLDLIRSKSLLLRSYFEVRADLEIMEDIAEKMESLLRRTKKPQIYQGFLGFILTFKKMILKRSSKKSILKTLNNTKYVYSKDWLLLKLENYKSEHALRKLKPE